VTDSGSDQQPEPPAEEQQPPPPRGDGDISRITVRLFEELKERAEQAAASQGLSLNSFVAQAVDGALRGAARGHGGRPGDFGPERHRHRGWDDGRGSRVQGWVQG
jgi:hypothetical protein